MIKRYNSSRFLITFFGSMASGILLIFDLCFVNLCRINAVAAEYKKMNVLMFETSDHIGEIARITYVACVRLYVRGKRFALAQRLCIYFTSSYTHPWDHAFTRIFCAATEASVHWSRPHTFQTKKSPFIAFCSTNKRRRNSFCARFGILSFRSLEQTEFRIWIAGARKAYIVDCVKRRWFHAVNVLRDSIFNFSPSKRFRFLE